MRVELGQGEVSVLRLSHLSSRHYFTLNLFQTVIINSHTMMVQYSQQNSDAEQNAPRLVKRGVPDEDKIPPCE